MCEGLFRSSLRSIDESTVLHIPEFLRRDAAEAAPVSDTAAKSRGWRPLKWLAAALAGLAATVPASAGALPFGSIGLLAPQLGLAAAVPVLVPVGLAVAVTAGTAWWICRKRRK